MTISLLQHHPLHQVVLERERSWNDYVLVPLGGLENTLSLVVYHHLSVEEKVEYQPLY